jgi:hypothetical protein
MIDNEFERLSEEAMSLRIAEKFFSEVERSLLRTVSPGFDVGKVKELLRIVNPRTGYDGDRSGAIEDLRFEFARWRESMSETDRGLETFHVRRFCDSSNISLNDTIYFSLARFYRSIPLTRDSQSKFDLMMTRAFAREMRGRLRNSHFDREAVADKVRELYSEWTESSAGTVAEEVDVEDAEIRFNAFIAEAYSLSEFDGLVESDIFERFREFKRDLGDTYFAPECVAAAVECNVTVGRTFDSLMAVMNTSLNQRLGERIDFAGALIDGSIEEQTSLVDLLAGMSGSGTEAMPVGNSDIALLRSFLQRATAANAEAAGTEISEEADQEVREDLEIEDKPENSIKHRLAAELATISQAQPDTYILRNYMSRTDALNHLDLNDFLFEENGQPFVLGRRALASILCLEEFKDNDLRNNKTLEPEITDEIVTILNFAESVGDKLEEALNAVEKDSQNRLLIVSNSLLSSRLQVERAVVRFTVPIPEPEPEPVVEEKPSEPVEITRAPLREANRWLMGATLLVFLVCGSILLFSGQNSNAAPEPEAIEEVNIGKLPAPEHLENAFRKDNTLYVVTKASWRGLKDDYKKKILQKMLELELRKPLYNVSLIGPDGQPVADISSEGPVIDEEVAKPDEVK